MPTRKEIKAKADEIKAWFATCDYENAVHRAAIKRSAEMIFSRQTMREQDAASTIDNNGRGFNGRDGEFGARVARWTGDLTIPLARGAKRMMSKYSRQLAEMKLGMP